MGENPSWTSSYSGMAELAWGAQGGTHLSLVWRERMSVGAPVEFRFLHRVVLCSLDNLAATRGKKSGGCDFMHTYFIYIYIYNPHSL